MKPSPVLLLALLLAFPVPPARAQGAERVPRMCVGNVWSADATRGRLTEKLNDMDALGVRAARFATGGGALTGEGIARARDVAEALRARGFKALLNISTPSGLAQRRIPSEEIYAGGAAWGPFLREYRDVFPYAIQVGNEPNNKIVTAYRNTLSAGGSEADAERVARERAAYFADVVVAFARGVKSTCPECLVTTGGLGDLGGVRTAAAVMYLERLAPHVQVGIIAPVLDVHVYRGRRSFARDAAGRVRWTEGFSAAVQRLLADAGWPATTTLQSTETNVPADDGWPSVSARVEAFEALLDGLHAVPRMNLVCAFSPWNDMRNDRWLIRPNTPIGDSLRASAAKYDG